MTGEIRKIKKSIDPEEIENKDHHHLQVFRVQEDLQKVILHDYMIKNFKFIYLFYTIYFPFIFSINYEEKHNKKFSITINVSYKF